MKPRELREIMPDFFEDEDHDDFVNLHEQFYSLLPAQQQVLRLYYEEMYEYEDIAHFYSITSEDAMKRVDRAVYALTGRLVTPWMYDSYEARNGQWDTRSKGRKAMSNAAARQITNGAWSN